MVINDLELKQKMEYCGDAYEGEYNNGRIEGMGKYTLPTGTTYTGQFYDGMFHNEGTLHFVNGSKYVGTWKMDGLEYNENVNYCNEYDRRFYTEICSGLKPAGRSQIVDKEPPKHIPEGCYDTGDGFYNPITKIVFNYEEKFLRNAGNHVLHLFFSDPEEHLWIVNKCRKAWDENFGVAYNPQENTSKYCY